MTFNRKLIIFIFVPYSYDFQQKCFWSFCFWFFLKMHFLLNFIAADFYSYDFQQKSVLCVFLKICAFRFFEKHNFCWKSQLLIFTAMIFNRNAFGFFCALSFFGKMCFLLNFIAADFYSYDFQQKVIFNLGPHFILKGPRFKNQLIPRGISIGSAQNRVLKVMTATGPFCIFLILFLIFYHVFFDFWSENTC